MTFDPAIPQPTDKPSVSQGQMLINFGRLNTEFAVEHNPLTEPAGVTEGKHKYVTLKQNPAAPVPLATDIILQQGLTPGSGKWSLETESAGPVFRHIPLRTLNTVAVNGGAPFDTNLVDFAAGAFGNNCSGTILVYDVINPDRLIFCPFVWNTPTLSIPGATYGQIISGGPAFPVGTNRELEYLNNAGSVLVLHHGSNWVAGDVRMIITESRTV